MRERAITIVAAVVFLAMYAATAYAVRELPARSTLSIAAAFSLAPVTALTLIVAWTLDPARRVRPIAESITGGPAVTPLGSFGRVSTGALAIWSMAFYILPAHESGYSSSFRSAFLVWTLSWAAFVRFVMPRLWPKADA